MKMNGIGGPHPLPPQSTDFSRGAKGAADAPVRAAPASDDRVELSEEARKLLQDGDAAARQARVNAARVKLVSGELLTPEVFDKTAEKLLLSGDLDA